MKAVLFLALSLAISYQAKSSTPLMIIQEGTPIVKDGVFKSGCEYGPLASLSDHAPLVWEDDQIATWNITSRVSHITVKVGKKSFLGHKFRTNEDGVLVNKKGKPILMGHKSEADLRGKIIVTNKHYLSRLKRIAKQIKKMFRNHDIDYVAVQEIPYPNQRDIDKNNLRDEFSFELGPELTIHYPMESQNRKRVATFEKPVDVALITKADVVIRKFPPNLKNRMQPFCRRLTKECIVASHLPNYGTDKEQEQSCVEMVELVQKLYGKGFKTVKIIGDFNASAMKILRSCKDVPGFTPIIKTTGKRAQSCSNNDGMTSPVNIDLLMIFKR